MQDEDAIIKHLETMMSCNMVLNNPDSCIQCSAFTTCLLISINKDNFFNSKEKLEVAVKATASSVLLDVTINRELFGDLHAKSCRSLVSIMQKVNSFIEATSGNIQLVS